MKVGLRRRESKPADRAPARRRAARGSLPPRLAGRERQIDAVNLYAGGRRGHGESESTTLASPRPAREAQGVGLHRPADGKQKRVYKKAEWTKDDAEQALAAVRLKIEQQPKAKERGLTLARAAERYVEAKARKRSLGDDIRILKHLEEFFGADTPLSEITASRIAEYKGRRLNTVRKTGQGGAATERPLAAGTVNRTLALLRHLLRLACEEWEVMQSIPKIRLEKEPQGCLRWITSEEARRLLDACRESRNANLVDLVEFSLFTGLRRSEALTLTWYPCRPSPWGHPARHHKEQQAAAGSPQPRSRRGPGPPRPARRQTRLRLTELGPLSCGVGERCHAREADRPSLA